MEYLNTFRCKSVAARPHNLSPLTKQGAAPFNMMIIAETGENYGDEQPWKWCRRISRFFEDVSRISQEWRFGAGRILRCRSDSGCAVEALRWTSYLSSFNLISGVGGLLSELFYG